MKPDCRFDLTCSAGCFHALIPSQPMITDPLSVHPLRRAFPHQNPLPHRTTGLLFTCNHHQEDIKGQDGLFDSPAMASPSLHRTHKKARPSSIRQKKRTGASVHTCVLKPKTKICCVSLTLYIFDSFSCSSTCNPRDHCQSSCQMATNADCCCGYQAHAR